MDDDEKLEVVAAYANMAKWLYICLLISVMANVVFSWRLL